MAEVAAIVVPIIQPLIEELSSGVWREMKMICSVEKDRMKLKELLETINSVLEEAERRSVSEVDLRYWLMKIKDAALDADDVVDDFQTESLRRRHLINLNVKGKVRDFFSAANNPFLFRYKMAHEIKDVISRFDELARLRRDFKLNEGSSSSSSSEVVHGRETSSFVDETKVYGREEDKEHIINLLVNEDQDKNLSVLPIVGLGGMGKTTLAQLVFNDSRRIQEHFEMNKWWVFVGKEFKIMNIISAIVTDTSRDTSASTLEAAQQRLRDKLQAKKFLLVLDDVWNVNRREWEGLETLLKCGKTGSKIIVTTRSEKIATIMGTTETPYKMKGLSKDKCMDLFRMRAFGPGKAEESPELIKIGEEIVEKCGGLPLAVKSLGGLMASKRGEHEWLAIRDSDIWKLPLEGEIENILPSLRLSYDHLPSDLKQCFAYCSVFPKDHKIERLKLIQIWIALGFIQSSREEVPVEDIGSQYFNILLQRSFLQNEVINDFSGVFLCEMHDLVHDLACLVSKGEFSTVQATTENKISLKGRYSSVINDDDIDIDKLALHIDNEAKKLRSLHILGFYGATLSEFELGPMSLVTHLRVLDLSGTSMEVVPKIIGKLKHLRFLDISGFNIKELPKFVCSLYNLQTLNLRGCSYLERLPEGIENLRRLRHLDIEGCIRLTEMPSGIGRLKHLRFLGISASKIKELSKSVCSLYNLQTLNLRHCRDLERLPEGIENLRSLRHLDIEGCDSLTKMPSGIGRLLRGLQTLPLFIVDERLRISELQNLNSICFRGKFSIKIRSRIDPREAMAANLGAKANIQSLVLEWMSPFEDEEGVLENLRPHPNLKHLSIEGYGGSRVPNWVGEASVLPNLKKLKLYRLDKCESLPSLGQLPSLEHLQVRWMFKLKRMGEEVYGDDGGVLFPALKSLDLSGLPDLEEWLVVARNDIIMFPLLEELEISFCPKLRTVSPHLPSSFVKFYISGIDEELLSKTGGSLQGLSRLTDLQIGRVKPSPNSSREWGGLQYLTSLRNLEVMDCYEVTKLPEGVLQLPSLQNLKLVRNRRLNSLGQQRPLFCTSLLHLTVAFCDALIALPEWVGYLTSLQDLTLFSCPKLKQLPDGLQRLTALQKLDISFCDELTKLPEGIGDLTSLQVLSLHDCPKLEQLPDGPQRLTGLQRLKILNCHLLNRRYNKETGMDSHKIAHIPSAEIE